MRDFGSRAFPATALFTLTLICRRRIIHGATYFEDDVQCSPIRDVTIMVQYDTIVACSSHGAWPETVVGRHGSMLCPCVLSLCALSVHWQTKQMHIGQIIYRQLRHHRTRLRFADRRAALCSGYSAISSSAQLFLFNCIYRPTDNDATELGVQQSTWVELMLWVAWRLGIHCKRQQQRTRPCPCIESTAVLWRLMSDVPSAMMLRAEQWLAAKMGTDKPG